MDFDELRKILELIREHDLTEFELERDDLKLRVRKAGVQPAAPAHVPAPPAPAVAPAGAPAMAGPPAAAEAPAAPGAQGGDEIELAIVKSPIVGTFYRSPQPTAQSFVEIGDVVKKGQVLCIIEAMKLMNEIDSEYDGEVATIYVENGQPVQYGERLFAIRPR
ncbi:MAG TPA: acetyl-CoA carboxylase biotin carboxyl carrier protein [Vicinamibacterales bacterium]|nr:acetyl-CoA carboxylase biotin carboxyl carrier protein [Vicinamibacterales bacterium]